MTKITPPLKDNEQLEEDFCSHHPAFSAIQTVQLHTIVIIRLTAHSFQTAAVCNFVEILLTSQRNACVTSVRNSVRLHCKSVPADMNFKLHSCTMLFTQEMQPLIGLFLITCFPSPAASILSSSFFFSPDTKHNKGWFMCRTGISSGN